MSRVIIHPAVYTDLQDAIDMVFKEFSLPWKGKSVLIKPNVLRAAKPEEAITTHPAVLRAIVEKVETLGVKSIIVGDNPGLTSYGANEESFEATGLMAAAKGHYRNIGNESRPMAFNADFAPAVSLSQAVLDADIIISVPKFKTHGLTVLSGAIKNSYGFLPGAQKAKLHVAAGNSKRFQEMIVELFRFRIPDLFIVDAILGMEGNGPASPDLRDIGKILASDNAVALDAVIAVMMGCDPGQLPFLRKAKDMGLGNYDLKTIDIVGALQPIPDFKIPHFSGESILRNENIQVLIKRRMGQRPWVASDACIGCALCVEQCPADALFMGDDNLPVADHEKCIACFCCQEVCPEKAITLK
ncbi:MAG: Ion-translocating oxidoreductase complex subunit B [Syntrophus sp. SKADARSKE-3]|nr:Ion-translocating oxidoreductase complex subunit B [Syntrophus sp. SKADARSKE-3]